MLDVRLRIPELMARRKWRTGYQLAKASGGRLSVTNAYHLVENAGNISRVSMDVLEVLCDVFDVDPGDLFEREKKRKTG